MGLREYKLAYGHGTQSVMLPEEHISDVLEGVPTPACDVKKATIECMRHPIGTKPLQELVKKGDKVCLVVADITRAWNRASEFTIHVVNELNLAGVPDEDIYIVFAQGTHRPHTDEENVTCVGEEVARRIKMYQHISTDKSMLTHMGVTKLGTDVWIDTRVAEADKVILINAVSTHDMAGFGGGRKLILPGVAGFETVQQNHCHALGPTLGSGLNPDAKLLKIEGNPVSDDMQEACDMVGPCFLVHSIINEEGEISSMVGGDPYKAWLEGTKETYRMQKVPMKQQADVTIVSAGGYPKDTNLYQGTKCYTTAEIATKKGGIIIYDGYGIHTPVKRTDVSVYRVDAMDAATEMKNEKAFNMLILGGLLKIVPMVKLENVLLGLKKSLPERHHKLIPMNEAAIKKGMEIITNVQTCH